MSRVRITENIKYSIDDLDYTKWPTVYFDLREEVFENRKTAVELYLDNEKSIEEITQITGIQRKELNNFVKKCLQRDNEGVLWGFRALISHKRVGESYVRISDTEGFDGKKLTGAFKKLLEEYPDIEKMIKEYVLNRRKRPVADRIIRVKDLRDDKFLKLCRALGIKLNEYPFNTKDKGLRSLYRFVDDLINDNLSEASNRFGEDTERRLEDLDGQSSHKELRVIPYECVHFDGHKIDAILTIKFTNIYGDEVVEEMRRIWLLLMMDEATRVVLGYYLCLSPEYSSADVLHCIKKAIVPWKPMNFTIPGLKYPDTIGFPTAVIPETNWAVWSELKLDNAFANLADIVRNKLTGLINCSVNPGKAKFPEARSIIERFFGLLTQNHIQRLGITTGSNPKDPKRKNPEKLAKNIEAKAEELEQLIEVVIAEYNSKKHSIFGISPLASMEQRIKYRDMLPRVLDENKRSDVSFFNFQTTRVIRGSKKSGKRPHINYEGVEYTSTLVARNFSLVGTEIIIEVNIDDISIIRAFLPDGQELDFLKARGGWGKRPHSLRTRKTINKLVREDKIRLDFNDSPVEALEKYWEEKATTDKTTRNHLAALQRYNQEHTQNDGMVLIEENEIVFEIETLDKNDTQNNNSNEDDLAEFKRMLKTIC
ncbi:hypothetical protein [Paenibacillus sp. WC2504]|uniref:hypothetical protein n=1 Tax=Paenibacillus sp. WC2504 TaxID=3461403 RepID=UPI004046486D